MADRPRRRTSSSPTRWPPTPSRSASCSAPTWRTDHATTRTAACSSSAPTRSAGTRWSGSCTGPGSRCWSPRAPPRSPLVIGISLGLLAGYLGGWVDAVVNRLTETAMAFPNLLLAVGLAVVIGPGLLNVVIIIALFTWYYPARIVRGATIATKQMTYRRGRQDGRRATAADPVRAPAAAGLGAAAGLRDLDHREQHHLRGGTVLPRRGRTAADSKLGPDAVGRGDLRACTRPTSPWRSRPAWPWS